MSSDARIKRIEALYGFHSDINSVSSAICTTLSYLSQEVWTELDKFESSLALLGENVRRCTDDLYIAENDYDSYISGTDPDDYDSYYASQLQAAVSDARERLSIANEKLSDGKAIVERARDTLMRINTLASSAIPSISSETSRIADAVEKAAFAAEQYMEGK